MTGERDAAGALSRLNAFIHHETIAGLLLVMAAAAAMLATNIEGLKPYYDELLAMPVRVSAGDADLQKPLLLWINDGLMAVFFFLVGLEIKREALEGNLASRDQLILPAIGAAGGMAVPALVYSFFNWGDADAMRGWAIPAATDIAFALGALSLAGSRVPVALKVFLLTLATLDDLGAIVIIALFYTSQLSLLSLAMASAAFAGLIGLNALRVDRTAPYIFLGIAMWLMVLKSGVHATLAGVILAMCIPLARRNGGAFLSRIEAGLHPYVSFLILPLFAFANAGVPVTGFALDKLAAPIPLGIAAGLTAGKPIGIMLAVGASVFSGIARLPEDCNWGHLTAAGCLGGIGFTMSLFIGSLAFEGAEETLAVRAGVIAGSLVSTCLGIAILWTAGNPSSAQARKRR